MYTRKSQIYSARTGDIIEIPFDSRVQSGNMVYRTYDKKLMDSLKKESESGSLRPKIPVFITATVALGRPIKLEIKDRDSNVVTIQSEYLVEKAKKQPTSKAQVEKQLSKLGNTLFEAAELRVTMERDVFIPVGQLNELRTKAIEQLENLRISRWKRNSRWKRKPLDNLQFFESGERIGRKQKKRQERKQEKLFKKILRCILYSRFLFIPLKGLKGHLQVEPIESISAKGFLESWKRLGKKELGNRA